MSPYTHNSIIKTPIKVMLVDDSAIVRSMVSRALAADKAIDIVATAINGKVAIDEIKKHDIDIVLLDIEMPEMDGITALPALLKASPGVRVIMNSSLTKKGASVSMKALSLGAVDYIAKPSSTGAQASLKDFYKELILKIKSIGKRKESVEKTAKQGISAGNKSLQNETDVSGSVKNMASKPIYSASGLSSYTSKAKEKPVVDTNKLQESIKKKRTNITYPDIKPRALAIASSTGGPQALLTLFRVLKGHLSDVPIFITQHMPPNFTTILAENISKATGKECVEGASGMKVENGKIYVAPGDYHMTVANIGGKMTIQLNQDEAVNYCRPSADPMTLSLINVYGRRLMLAVLTGMGNDGIGGATALHKTGGFTIAQDEESSVVWGMPRAVVEKDVHNVELPLNEIAKHIIKSFT